MVFALGDSSLPGGSQVVAMADTSTLSCHNVGTHMAGRAVPWSRAYVPDSGPLFLAHT